jgi:phosphatidylglycerol:prolipoprotein diacylglycerol transferase
MMMLGFLIGTWWASKRADKVKCDAEFVVNLCLIILISSIIGARFFYVVHYWDEKFAGKGLWTIINVRQGGIEFYGGFIGAVLATVIVLRRRGLSLRLYLDILTPSVAMGLAFGRIGCFLHGCCWGGVCSTDMAWAVTFPHDAPATHRHWEDRQLTVPAELIRIYPDGEAFLDMPQEDTEATFKNLGIAPIRSHAVHPAQLYASIDAFFLAIVLHLYFFRRKRHGMVFAVFLIGYAVIRFVEESIRGDNPHDTLHLTISQFVSVVLLFTGIALIGLFHYLPIRSPRAVPFVPPSEEPEPRQNGKKSKKTQRNRRRR